VTGEPLAICMDARAVDGERIDTFAITRAARDGDDEDGEEDDGRLGGEVTNNDGACIIVGSNALFDGDDVDVEVIGVRSLPLPERA
jgi:hypothetical protein